MCSPRLRLRHRALAVFASFSCFVGLVAVVPRAAQAQSAIVVTGSRVGVSADRLAADVVVIDAQRIADSAADSLEDLLRREAGVQLSRSGPPGQTAGLMLRGSNAGHALVLVDGVRIGSGSAGQAELEGLSLAHIERIEVLRGPASSLYGSDAVGGVVQIFTRRGDDELWARAQLAGGGFGAREGSAAMSWGNGAIDLAASAAAERLDGVSALRPGDRFGTYNPDRDGFTRRSAAFRLGGQLGALQRLSLQATTSRLNAQYDGSEFLPPSYAQDSRADFRNHLDLDTASLEHQARWSPDWRSELRASRQTSELRTGGTQVERFRTERTREEALLSWIPSGAQQLTLALDHLRERVQASAYADEALRSNRGLTLAWVGSFDGLSLQGEARHDRNSQFGSASTGRLGLNWRATPLLRLRALVGTSFRAPAFNDLVYPGYGVPTLQPERGRSVEAGLDWRDAALPQLSLKATLFRNTVRELISYEPDRSFCPAGSAYDFGCARNLGRARLQGASLGGQWRVGAWSTRLDVDLLDARDLDSGARLIRRAAHQESLRIERTQGAWSFEADLLRIGARPEAGKTLAAATTLDLAARWKPARGWTLQLQLRNATDRDVEPARDFQSLGRQWWLALRWESA